MVQDGITDYIHEPFCCGIEKCLLCIVKDGFPIWPLAMDVRASCFALLMRYHFPTLLVVNVGVTL